jgi:hypothetical protein
MKYHLLNDEQREDSVNWLEKREREGDRCLRTHLMLFCVSRCYVFTQFNTYVLFSSSKEETLGEGLKAFLISTS